MEGPTSCRVTNTEEVSPSIPKHSTVRVIRNDRTSSSSSSSVHAASRVTVGANMPQKNHRTTAFMPIAKYLESSTNSIESGSQSQSYHPPHQPPQQQQQAPPAHVLNQVQQSKSLDGSHISGITSKGSSSVASAASNKPPKSSSVLPPPTCRTPSTARTTDSPVNSHSPSLDWGGDGGGGDGGGGGADSHTSTQSSSYVCNGGGGGFAQETGVPHTDLQAYLRATSTNLSPSRSHPHNHPHNHRPNPTTPGVSPENRQDGASPRSITASTTHRNRHHPHNTQATLVVLTVSNQRRILLHKQHTHTHTHTRPSSSSRRKRTDSTTSSSSSSSSSSSDVYLPFYQPVTHADATPAHAAVRNLASATSLIVPLEVVRKGAVGSMYYSYIDNNTETIWGEIVYLYHIDIDTLKHNTVSPTTTPARTNSNLHGGGGTKSRKRRRKREAIAVDASKIHGSNNETPTTTTSNGRTTTTTTTTLQWFDDWDHLPLHQMHPTDTIWLSTLLETMEDSRYAITFDAWFQCSVSSSSSSRTTRNGSSSSSSKQQHSERVCGYNTCLERSNTTRILHSFLSMTDPTIEDHDGLDSSSHTKEHVVIYDNKNHNHNDTPSSVVSSQTNTPLKATVQSFVTTSTPNNNTPPVTLPIHATVTPQTPKVKRRSSLGSDSIPTRATVVVQPTVLTTSKPPKTASTSNNNNNSNNTGKMTLEKRLFHALHNHKHDNNNDSSSPPTPKPSIKEFKEAWAFANATRSFYSMHTSSKSSSSPPPPPIDLVLDVAGGHGALAALFLSLTPAQRAVVIDPADVGGGGVQQRWGEFFKGKSLEYRHECLRTGLRTEIESALRGGRNGRRSRVTEDDGDDERDRDGGGGGLDPRRILVVACHACQHLTDETMEIACSYGVHVAVMPCCQKDNTNGSSLKEFAKQTGIEIGLLMDILAAGKVMSWNVGTEHDVRYQVRMKTIDKNITPQNRLILCKACDRQSHDAEAKRTDEAHARLESAYRKAHGSHKLREHDEKFKHVPQEHREQGGIGLSMMRFARRVLYKSSQEGNSTMEQCKSIRKDLKESKGSASSASDTLFWKNLRLLSLLQLTRNTEVDKAVNIGVEDVEDVGNPIHGISAVRHLQDSLSTETIAAAGILFGGSILSVLLANSSSTHQR